MKSSIWALADLHLSFSRPSKTMEAFGSSWKNYQQRLEHHWKESVQEGDLVLLAGDITWAMTLEEAKIDLEWIDKLPGFKVLLKGNHDYWWTTPTKMQKEGFKNLIFLQNNSYVWNDIGIGGARLWDTPEYRFDAYIDFVPNTLAKTSNKLDEDQERRLFCRELERLQLSLKSIPGSCKKRLAMTHYPPIGADLQPSEASKILEAHQVDTCVFGHLHSVKPGSLPFGEARGIRYIFCAADYCQFKPIKIL